MPDDEYMYQPITEADYAAEDKHEMTVTYHKNGSSDGMTMMTWMATEGGRKCPICGKYAKKSELGSIGGTFLMGDVPVHINAHGHLPGYGCNRNIIPMPDATPEETPEERKSNGGE